MTLAFSYAHSRDELIALSAVLDRGFEQPKGTTIWRTGLLFELVQSGQLLVLATRADVPVGGLVALRGDGHAALTHIAVTPEARRAGIGHALFCELTAWAEKQGFPEIRWNVEPDNAAAIAAYTSWGARITGELEEAFCFNSPAPVLGVVWRFDSWFDENPKAQTPAPGMAKTT
ncbi:MAG: GNAT family N-acetyltransferase [Corynebacteriales bacterium]|nr:GNAT family N-acetyltransferase [Mycobacteriales bacterium]